MDVTYFSIEGNCHGEYFHRVYRNPQAIGNSELKVASSMQKESSIDSKARVKQFNDFNSWLASEVRGVLERNQFTGWLKVYGKHRPDGKRCEISLSISGCDGDYCPG